MSLKNYGVLKGRPVDKRLGSSANAHYHVHLVDDTVDYRIAINVESKQSPSEVEYLVVENFQFPGAKQLTDLPSGFSALESKPGTPAIDFIRSNLFDSSKMVPLPFDVPGADNDLNEKLDKHITRAMADENALVYAFGQRWGPEAAVKDKIFGFLPGNGIHDIHMNQGNAGQFAKDNGIYQDGALFIHFPHEDEWVAIFLKFQSQTWHTDDQTGNRIDTNSSGTAGSAPGKRGKSNKRRNKHQQKNQQSLLPGIDVSTLMPEPDGLVRIVAAVVHPDSTTPETVTLLNCSPEAVNLEGWSIANRVKKKQSLTGTLAAGETLQVKLEAGFRLSDAGGIITLLNDQQLKVDGVSYTQDDSKSVGWSIVF
jgi:uncharacterized protein YukJ